MMHDEEFGSDTDDDDYVPPGEAEAVSDEEGSGDDEGEGEGGNQSNKSKNKEKRGTASKNTFARGAANNESKSWEADIAKEKQQLQEEKEKQKANDIWADFKSSVKTQPKPATASKSSSNLFVDLFKDTPKASVTSRSDSAKPEHLANSSAKLPSAKDRFSSLFDVTPKPSAGASESTVLGHHQSSGNGGGKVKKPASLLSSLFDDADNDKTIGNPNKVDGKTDQETTSQRDGSNDTGQMVEITKEYDFAGETVKITKSVDASSSEAQKFIKNQEANEAKGQKRSGGLASFVDSINKKKKMGCLDKSKLDWDQYVEEEGIKEDLKTFNKGKDGYVEKQLFLERADLRQFEVEKAIRDKNRKSLMK